MDAKELDEIRTRWAKAPKELMTPELSAEGLHEGWELWRELESGPSCVAGLMEKAHAQAFAHAPEDVRRLLDEVESLKLQHGDGLESWRLAYRKLLRIGEATTMDEVKEAAALHVEDWNGLESEQAAQEQRHQMRKERDEARAEAEALRRAKDLLRAYPTGVPDWEREVHDYLEGLTP